MKNRLLTSILMLQLLLAACDDTHDSTSVQMQPVQIEVMTRGTENSLWTDGDEVTLFSSTESSPTQLKFNGTEWKRADGEMMTALLPATFFAVHPAADNAEFTLPTDQSTEEKLKAADWMTTDDSEAIANPGTAVNLTFKHMFCRIEITVSGYKNEFGGTVPTVANPLMRTNLFKFERATDTNGAYARYKELNVMQDVTPLFTQSADGKHKISCFFSAETLASNNWFSLEVNGKRLKAIIDGNMPIEAGKVYRFNLVVGKDLLHANLAGIADFIGSWQREVPIDYVVPQIGDYLYEDGTWSSTWATSKKAVGVVFATATTESDQSAGYYNGYALAMNETSTTSQFKTSNTTDDPGSFTWVNREFSEVIERNRDGRTYTAAIDNDEHPAVKAARGYTYGGTANIQAWASEWFIPSYGQWCDILINLGGAAATPDFKTSTSIYWSHSLDQLNNYFKGKSGAAEIKGKDYWTSSYRRGAKVFHIVLNANQPMMLETDYTNKCKVRPAIAF